MMKLELEQEQEQEEKKKIKFLNYVEKKKRSSCGWDGMIPMSDVTHYD